MKGAIGTSMGPGNSRKWAAKWAIRSTIHACHLLKLVKQGEHLEPEILAACEKATTSPSLLEPWEKAVIHKEWERWAITGRLRGIVKLREFKEKG